MKGVANLPQFSFAWKINCIVEKNFFQRVINRKGAVAPSLYYINLLEQ